MIEKMAAMTERIVNESIDDLVREAEALKSRLEEERAKFNDMECKYLRFFSFSSRISQFHWCFFSSNHCR